MRILSFDQSTRCSGYAFFEDAKYIPVSYTHLTLPTKA